jgi:hypothetical protein
MHRIGLALMLAVPTPAVAQDGGGTDGTPSGTTGGAAEVKTAGRYQIVEATPRRVWRLDTKTGEIAICQLNGDRLVCTASSEAARPDPKDYETLKAEEQAAEQQDAERKLAFIEKILSLFREFVRYALTQGQDGGGGDGA